MTIDERSPATPVLVLGGELTALGVVRSLARAGIPAFVATDPGPIVRDSRWYRPAPFTAPVDCRTPLADLLERSALPRAVLMPCSDAWARAIADLEPRFADRFPSCSAAPGVLDLFQDKQRFAELLDEIGAPHPVTIPLRSAADLDAVPEEAFGCAFLKARHSQCFFQRLGVKAFRVAGRPDAARRLESIAAAGLEVVLQEYIPGPPSHHHFIDGFVDRDGRLVTTLCRQRLRMHPADFGNSTFMVSEPRERVVPALATVAALLEHVRYRGIFSAEFKWDERDRRFKLLEVNARPWWYVEFASRCGVNVCAMAWRDALGMPNDNSGDYRTGETLVYPYYDLWTCRELHRRGELTLAGWVRSWLGAEQPVFEWADPRPALAAMARAVLRRLRAIGGRRAATGAAPVH